MKVKVLAQSDANQFCVWRMQKRSCGQQEGTRFCSRETLAPVQLPSHPLLNGCNWQYVSGSPLDDPLLSQDNVDILS
eukprot:4786169-Amphidinium_carterae.1